MIKYCRQKVSVKEGNAMWITLGAFVLMLISSALFGLWLGASKWASVFTTFVLAFVGLVVFQAQAWSWFEVLFPKDRGDGLYFAEFFCTLISMGLMCYIANAFYPVVRVDIESGAVRMD